jgi:hypothetical protein
MPEPVLAFHPLSSIFPLIEIAEFDALPTLGSSVTKRHRMPLAQFAGPISGTPPRLPQRLEPGRAAIDHRPSTIDHRATSLVRGGESRPAHPRLFPKSRERSTGSCSQRLGGIKPGFGAIASS